MAFSLNSTFVDSNKEKSGIWVEFFEGSELKIASKDSPMYKAYLANLARKNKVKIGEKNVRPETMELMQLVTCDAMAKHLLLDWKGIALDVGGEDGAEEVPYSYDTGKMALLNSHELFDFVDEVADDSSRFAAAQEEEVKKPSSGISNGDLP